MSDVFVAKITHARLIFSPFTSEEMFAIAQATLDSVITRIKTATDLTDSAAKPLTAKYAAAKKKGRHVGRDPQWYRGQPIRDWTLRGTTLAACKVKMASENKATFGPTTRESTIVIRTQNKQVKMWGISPHDQEAMYAAVRLALSRRNHVQVEKTMTAGAGY